MVMTLLQQRSLRKALHPELPLLQDVKLDGKVVLVRVDHNVVKNGKIDDAFRIEASLPTLFNIVSSGGLLILMTHVGRPYDKKAYKINVDEKSSVQPIVDYLRSKLKISVCVPDHFATNEQKGIESIDTSVNFYIRELKARRVGAIYLPNTRWFTGEEGRFGQDARERFAVQLAGLADIYVNDAFGSWQPHVSTHDITQYLPSYAGLLMQAELRNLKKIAQPERPFLAVVAGSKYDTKVGPLTRIWHSADHLVLGGVLYNAYLCAKYDIKIQGIADEEVEMARDLVKLDREKSKILELPIIVESDTMEGRIAGRHRNVDVRKLKKGDALNFILDVAPESFEVERIRKVFLEAKLVFVNAVMGYTDASPPFMEGTHAMDSLIAKNKTGHKMFGGGDTLQIFRSILPGIYMSAQDDSTYYMFTGGGTVLTAIEKGDPCELPTVQALIENGRKRHKVVSNGDYCNNHSGDSLAGLIMPICAELQC
eukprot:jgi/Chlat1/5717/Chrsp38S05553